MAAIEDLAHLSAVGVGRLIASGDVTSVEATEFFLDRANLPEAQNVYITLTKERALAEARAADARARDGRPASALDGVPIVWKDLFDLAGTPTTAASALLSDAPPAAADAPCVANATAAGLVALGKVNLTEFAFSGLGLNPHFGTPRNPHDKEKRRIPGGSSSGSAVAVAAGLAPCAIGSDTGGSVRVPAALNGIVGYKSSEGRIDKSGVFPLSTTLDTVGPLARTVEDCVLLDSILRGAVASDIRRAPVSGLKLVVPTNVVMDGVEDAVGANFEQALGKLADAGATIERKEIPAFGGFLDLLGRHGSLIAAEAYYVHQARIDGDDRERVDRRVVARIDGGKAMSAHDYISLVQARPRLFASLAASLDGGLMAMPTVAHVAPEIAPLEADDELFHAVNLKTLRNTFIGNFLRTCGLAIPSGTDAQGLPTSILIAGQGGEDERLLAHGLEIERVLRG